MWSDRHLEINQSSLEVFHFSVIFVIMFIVKICPKYVPLFFSTRKTDKILLKIFLYILHIIKSLHHSTLWILSVNLIQTQEILSFEMYKVDVSFLNGIFYLKWMFLACLYT